MGRGATHGSGGHSRSLTPRIGHVRRHAAPCCTGLCVCALPCCFSPLGVKKKLPRIARIRPSGQGQGQGQGTSVQPHHTTTPSPRWNGDALQGQPGRHVRGGGLVGGGYVVAGAPSGPAVRRPALSLVPAQLHCICNSACNEERRTRNLHARTGHVTSDESRYSVHSRNPEHQRPCTATHACVSFAEVAPGRKNTCQR